ncbi:hypothetical protein [Kordia sp.]|uniref:hypothetical protein n=1 Tax=Kordia sp. TaxID=1965332 RepID=UPI003D6C58DC
MKHLKLKKIKIAKIDHVNTIMGGYTTEQTYDERCIADLKSKWRENEETILVIVCPTNTGRTLVGNATGIAETEGCNG